MIMGIGRRLAGAPESRTQTLVLRGLAIAIAAFGVQSLIAINVSSKLLMQFSMEFWDFQSATAAFFWHHITIIGLGAVFGHYGRLLLPLRRPAA